MMNNSWSGCEQNSVQSQLDDMGIALPENSVHIKFVAEMLCVDV